MMAPPELSSKYLWDARRAAERVARFTAGRGFDDDIADDVLRSAVERQPCIVGEALAALRRADPALAGAVPELPRIVAFRNILVHGYASVDDRLVWGVVERDLAGLLVKIERLLDSESEGEEP